MCHGTPNASRCATGRQAGRTSSSKGDAQVTFNRDASGAVTAICADVRCRRVEVRKRCSASSGDWSRLSHMSEPPTLPSVLTAEELLYLSLPDKRAELVRGRLVVREPPGYRHGVVAFAIATRIGAFVEANDLGVVVAAETGFKLFSNPDTVRAAGAAFLSRHRAPDAPPVGYLELAPDLAVAVVLPSEKPSPRDRPMTALSR